MPATDARLALILDWLAHDVRLAVERVEPASADASFRRYFRVFHAGGTLIVMDAPPPQEDVRPYMRVSGMLQRLGVHVPRIHEQDERRGLLLLEDLGATSYLARLEAGGDPDALYGDALDALADIQAWGGEAAATLPPYDRETLHAEMALMPEWLCGRHLRLELTASERDLLAECFEALATEALAQPQVLVHRDYHSRNLMVCAPRNPGVLDFQDARRGPLAYDLVSLLEDSYIAWPRERVVGWVTVFRARLGVRRAAHGLTEGELLRWLDLIGVQRHLKVLGIFARLWYRDGKPGYLPDLPLTLRYTLEACMRHRELAALGRFLAERVAPALPRANARELAPQGATS